MSYSKNILQALAILEHYTIRLTDWYSIILLAVGFINGDAQYQKYAFWLILSIVMETQTSNVTYFYDREYNLAYTITYVFFVIFNISKLYLAYNLLAMTTEIYLHYLLIVISTQTVIYFVFGLVIYMFLKLTLSEDTIEYYRNCRRMMERYPKNN